MFLSSAEAVVSFGDVLVDAVFAPGDVDDVLEAAEFIFAGEFF